MSTSKKTANRTPFTDRKPARRQNKRAQENKAIRREALREELQAREYLRQLEHIDREFGEIHDRVKALRGPAAKASRDTVQRTNRQNGLELEKAETRIRALKERANLNFKRLNKVLPDLKAVELSDPEGKNPFGNLLEAMRLSVRDDQEG